LKNKLNMKKLMFVLALFTAAVGSKAQNQIVTDPNAELRPLKESFHGIHVSNAIELVLTQGSEEGVAVSASRDEFRKKIKTSVEGGILKIWYENEGKWWNTNRKLKAYVSFKTLDQLRASGAAVVKVTGTMKVNELKMDFSGASDFVGTIEANQVDADVSGASYIRVSGGKVTKLTIDASGASGFKGYDFIADNCNVEASGASTVQVNISNELNASVSGASDVNYKGDGKIRNLKTSGASSVSRKS